MLLVFATVMLTTVLISGFPRLTIYLMELFRFYKKGVLSHEPRNYVDGGGHHVYRKVYCFNDHNAGERFVNMQVFLRSLLISFIFCTLAMIVTYLFVFNKLPGFQEFLFPAI